MSSNAIATRLQFRQRLEGGATRGRRRMMCPRLGTVESSVDGRLSADVTIILVSN